jgi:SAM-dependent methyltransferase
VQVQIDSKESCSLTDLTLAAGELSINLGAGCRPDNTGRFRNQDLYPGPCIDDVFDLDGPWPYISGTVKELYACHVLEHVKDVKAVMLEAQRVLIPGGHFTIRVPSPSSDAAMFDLTHRRPLYPATFFQFMPRGAEVTWNPQHKENFPCKFHVEEVRWVLSDEVERWPLRKFWKGWIPLLDQHLRNVTSELWLRLHRLPDEEVKRIQLHHGELGVKTVYMTGKESIEEMWKWDCHHKKGE